MRTEDVRFAASDGVELEGSLETPDELRGSIVLCHPHPQLGGTMDAPLLLALRDALVAKGWGVLRFNFRGIGSSTGRSSTGDLELQDARAALGVITSRFEGHSVCVAGWSFGGAVAVRVATANQVDACVAVAPSVKAKQGITEGLPAVEDVELRIPVLFVCGENDDVVSPADCRSWVEKLPQGRYVELAGANHFFWAKYDDLAATVTAWLDEETA